MDVAGWILAAASAKEGASIQETFPTWADKYMKPRRTLGCSSLDLYAARCAILHTMTPESDLYRRGRARQIVYAWHPSKVEQLRLAADFTRGYVSVQGETLVRTFHLAVTSRFIPDLKGATPTPQLQQLMDKIFTILPPSETDRMHMLALAGAMLRRPD
jgi:hypothetical protein